MFYKKVLICAVQLHCVVTLGNSTLLLVCILFIVFANFAPYSHLGNVFLENVEELV
jgi:hypothetical protein